MTIKIGVASQKGGVGKSTICRLIAREYAKSGWSVKIADLDVSQGTCFDWQSRRMSNHITPEVPVERFSSVSQALKFSHVYDPIIFDGKPYATSQTLEIAKEVNLLILPTGLALDDLRPSVLLAKELCENKGIPKGKLAFAFCRTGDSDVELGEAQTYISESGYSYLDGAMPEKGGYRRASDLGLSPTETRFPSLNKKADILAQSIIDKITKLQTETEVA
jgi:chromosome partitioning protein